jgi:aryl-alcohol dehydrogenase-like predicted oxidoreductase
MKIALGTVQWGLDYGIANTHGIPSDEVLNSIFALANKAGINMFDTAAQYGEAEKRVGQFSNLEHKIVTKIGNLSTNKCLNQQLDNSFNHLQRQNIYGCLFHNGDELINNTDLWRELLVYKEEGRINKIGYSLYEPQELFDLLEAGLHPDIVQLPYSILDRKFEPYFDLLKKKGVEIHVRSVFLQGLYFKNPEQLSDKLSILKSVLSELQNISKQNNLDISELCLDFIRQNCKIDYAVIGVESEDQLREVSQVKNCNLNWGIILETLDSYNIKKELLNPSNW